MYTDYKKKSQLISLKNILKKNYLKKKFHAFQKNNLFYFLIILAEQELF